MADYEATIRVLTRVDPAVAERYDVIHQYDTVLDQAKRRAATFQEKQAIKRVDELLFILFDDLDWKLYHPTVYDFMRQHLIFRRLWFQQIMTDEEIAQVHEEVEALLRIPPFARNS